MAETVLNENQEDRQMCFGAVEQLDRYRKHISEKLHREIKQRPCELNNELGHKVFQKPSYQKTVLHRLDTLIDRIDQLDRVCDTFVSHLDYICYDKKNIEQHDRLRRLDIFTYKLEKKMSAITVIRNGVLNKITKIHSLKPQPRPRRMSRQPYVPAKDCKTLCALVQSTGWPYSQDKQKEDKTTQRNQSV